METPGHTATARVVSQETARAPILPHASPLITLGRVPAPQPHTMGLFLNKAEISQLNFEVSWSCHLQYRKQAVLNYKPRNDMWRLLAEN